MGGGLGFEERGVPGQPKAGELPGAADSPELAKVSPPPPVDLRSWLEAPNVEAIFTAFTFVGMVAGLIAERISGLTLLPILLYGLAYVTGGIYGLKAGLASLQERKIDVDLLMILAAVGAAIVGEPFEGVMLLFLFSLSNVLQDYALGRTRRAISALMALRPDQAIG